MISKGFYIILYIICQNTPKITCILWPIIIGNPLLYNNEIPGIILYNNAGAYNPNPCSPY
jgi:hypothetical protein